MLLSVLFDDCWIGRRDVFFLAGVVLMQGFFSLGWQLVIIYFRGDYIKAFDRVAHAYSFQSVDIWRCGLKNSLAWMNCIRYDYTILKIISCLALSLFFSQCDGVFIDFKIYEILDWVEEKNQKGKKNRFLFDQSWLRVEKFIILLIFLYITLVFIGWVQFCCSGIGVFIKITYC